MQDIDSLLPHVGLHSHDTISMAVIDKIGRVAVGPSTNGATFKIPGRNTVSETTMVGERLFQKHCFRNDYGGERRKQKENA
ncbi:hypothetical protein K1719_030266 [Acacia pycnantha]|nr:hypothetical protein K1719_030266 [Acacia pycnantha]